MFRDHLLRQLKTQFSHHFHQDQQPPSTGASRSSLRLRPHAGVPANTHGGAESLATCEAVHGRKAATTRVRAGVGRLFGVTCGGCMWSVWRGRVDSSGGGGDVRTER